MSRSRARRPARRARSRSARRTALLWRRTARTATSRSRRSRRAPATSCSAFRGASRLGTSAPAAQSSRSLPTVRSASPATRSRADQRHGPGARSEHHGERRRAQSGDRDRYAGRQLELSVSQLAVRSFGAMWLINYGNVVVDQIPGATIAGLTTNGTLQLTAYSDITLDTPKLQRQSHRGGLDRRERHRQRAGSRARAQRSP